MGENIQSNVLNTSARLNFYSLKIHVYQIWYVALLQVTIAYIDYALIKRLIAKEDQRNMTGVV